MKDLDPLKQQKFQAPTTVDECLEAIVLNGQKRRSFTRILEFLRPLIDPLKRFESAIDVVVQVNAGIVSPIWGPLRVALTVGISRTGGILAYEVLLTFDILLDSYPASGNPGNAGYHCGQDRSLCAALREFENAFR